MQPKRPPAAQLLYNLGLEAEDCMVSEIGPDISLTHAIYPLSLPMMDFKSKWEVPAVHYSCCFPYDVLHNPGL